MITRSASRRLRTLLASRRAEPVRLVDVRSLVARRAAWARSDLKLVTRSGGSAVYEHRSGLRVAVNIGPAKGNLPFRPKWRSITIDGVAGVAPSRIRESTPIDW